MTLSEYRRLSGLTIPKLAVQLGRPVITVKSWVTGTRLPSLAEIPTIEAATAGQVTASDWITAAVNRKQKEVTS